MITELGFTDTYTMLEKIGEGSGGTVYKAYHNRLHKYVVLKQLNHPGRSVIKSRQEVDILKNLNHSYLPQVLDFLETEKGIYTVMSFIPGKSLEEVMKERSAVSAKELLKWGMQLCSALNYLHTQKIPVVHGDIKPSNVMLTPDGDICLIDFNISFFLDERTVLGYTDGYSSPEQYLAVSGKRSRKNTRFVIDQKSDIYSVGATLYYLATGLKRSRYEKEIDMRRLTNTVGEPFAQIIVKAVNLDPEERFASAYDMFQALQKLPEKDQRYQKFLRMQFIKIGCLAVGALLFLCLGGFGFLTIQQDRYDRYDEIVNEQIALQGKGDFSLSEEKFQEAVDLIPSQLEAYYQEAYALYLQGAYEDSIAFIENEILGNNDVKQKGDRMVDIYALEGLNYIELGNGKRAVEKYVKAMEYGAFQGEHYRDYAIALAYEKQYEKAEEMLERAEDFGADPGGAAYTQGEIHYAKGELTQALSDFDECINVSEDPYMRMRAFLMESKVYRQQGDVEAVRRVLRKAAASLPIQQQPAVLETLVQADIDLAEQTGSASYEEEAIDYLQEIISNNWAGYSDYDALAVLYLKQKDYTGVAQTLETMKEKYGEDYNLYKRYAFLELNRQQEKSQEDRDYLNFLTYYDEADSRYSVENKGNSDDPEMYLLEDAYSQLRTGGWL